MRIKTQDGSGVSCLWTVKEKHGDLWIPKLHRKNIFTNDGLNNLAQAIGGTYAAPIYLIIENSGGLLTAPVNIGQTTATTNNRIDLTGDTQLILGVNSANQETVTFSGAPTGTGPYTYTISAATKSHLTNDLVARVVSQNDNLTSVVGEIQYDPTDAPGQRVASTAGYRNGIGNWTVQFYISSTQAVNTLFMYVGLSDNPNVGMGVLHNHLVLGYNHVSGNDVEIDGSLTLTNV